MYAILKEWLENEIKNEDTLGDEAREIEVSLGVDYPKVLSTGHYQRSVAYKKCLQQLKRLESNDPHR